ncbi:MAG: hypothetical protein RL131_1031, partial [Bacteroidota bacterium]
MECFFCEIQGNQGDSNNYTSCYNSAFNHAPLQRVYKI